MAEMLTIDGSMGEGGGQVLRSALTLSLVTGKSFRIDNVRAGRQQPGLRRQHLAALTAAAEVGSAKIEGAALGSKAFAFQPGRTLPGPYRFAVGTAGSATLVLQTVLPALMTAEGGASEIVLEGGTHNPSAPPFDFLDRVLLPLLGRMGPRITVELERPGFYPAGGGRFRALVEPVSVLNRIDLIERGEVVGSRAVARVCRLPLHIAERELAAVRDGLSWGVEQLAAERLESATGPGNCLTLEVESEHITELFTGFGSRGKPAEQVAADAIEEVRGYLASGVPAGPYLADQLVVPMAIAGGGSYRTVRPTRHTLTNIEVVRLFMDIAIAVEQEDHASWHIVVGDSATFGPERRLITIGSVTREQAAQRFPFLAHSFKGRRSAIKDFTHRAPEFVFWIFSDGRLHDAGDSHRRNIPKGYDHILNDAPEYGGFLRGRLARSADGNQLVVVYCRQEALCARGPELVQLLSGLAQLPVPLDDDALVISDNGDIYGTVGDLRVRVE